MKIGLVLSSTPAYSETFFNSKIEGLQKNGFEVVLFVNSKNTHFDLCTVKEQVQYRSFFILEFFLKSLGLLLTKLSTLLKFISLERKCNVSFKRILKKLILNQHILQESNVDWLHFGFATQAIGRENIAKAMGAKMAVSLRGFDIDVFPLKNKNCYNLLWRKVDKVHSISKYLLNKSYSLGLSKLTKFKVIPPAIENIELSKPFEKNSTIKIVTIGRLHWMKNYSCILKALKEVKQKGIKFKYHIIGEGILKEALQYESFEYDLEEFIVFEGKLTHKQVLNNLESADLYIQYSHSEGFCNAVLEAQSMGVLPIVSNAEGLSENVLNNKTGWVIEKNSPKLLAEKIVEVINLPESNKEIIRKQAIERVLKEFNIEKQQKEFIDFYTL
jgi:colanic acid/amylovoran biosynthesis glycosyltransferase